MVNANGKALGRASLLATFFLSTIRLQAATLEEVVVTAQHREQSLQDVPVSVSAIAGDKMMEAGINRLEDLTAYVPNLTVNESAISTDIYIRGIGTGMNQGFEQSVGMYVDGIYYGRAQLARAPFLDLSRVEVLRGPQNILHGKNSIAGAVSLITANPGDEFEGLLSVLHEPKYGEEVYDLMLSGPITDKLGARFSARLRRYDGYFENLTLDRDEPNLDEATYRLKLAWAATENLAMSLKLEAGKFDAIGRRAEIINDEPSTSDTALFTGRTEAEILDRTFFPPLVDVDSHDSVRNNVQDFKRSSNGDFSNNDTQNVTFNVDWFSNGGHQFTAITGYMAYKYDDLCDCDGTGAPLFKLALAEDYDQYSQEFRWLSPVGERFEFIGGIYLQYHELHFVDELVQDSPTVVQLLNAADFQDGGARGDFDPDPLGGSPEEVAGIGDAGNAVANIKAPRHFFNESSMGSAFLQSTFHATDTLRLTLGGRYTYETKKGSRRLVFTDLAGNLLPISETDTVAAISFGAERHDLKGERTEEHFSPLVNLQWDYSPDGMAYITATKGFKAGGFDARSNATPEAELTPINPGAAVPNRTVLLGTFEYDEEEAVSYEFGVKTGLLEGAAELNLAMFYTEYSNLQVSIFDGVVGFKVGNAKEAVTAGIELDGRWQVTEFLTVGGALSVMDFEFTDFKNGQCKQDQVSDSGDGVHCDYTGQSNQYVADWQGTLMLGYLRPISYRLGVGFALDVVFTDDFNPSSNLDPRVEQDSFALINGRVGIGSTDRSWELSLVGKNLTDERVVAYAVDTPLSKNIFGATSHIGGINPPRTLALQATYRW